MAGLFAAYTFIEEPNLFDAYIIMSPAFWWNKEELTLKLKSFLSSNPALEKVLYFGIGAKDGRGMKQELRRFVAEIERSRQHKLRWLHEEFDREGHMSAPLLTNYYALKFIFSDMQLPKDIRHNYSDSGFLAHEAGITKKYGESARQTQEVYVRLAMRLIKQKNYNGAITVLQRNAQAYEANKYPQNYVWLAEAFEKNEDLEGAIRNYKKAYKLSLNTGYGEMEKYRLKIEELKTVQSSFDKQ